MPRMSGVQSAMANVRPPCSSLLAGSMTMMSARSAVARNEAASALTTCASSNPSRSRLWRAMAHRSGCRSTYTAWAKFRAMVEKSTPNPPVRSISRPRRGAVGTAPVAAAAVVDSWGLPDCSDCSDWARAVASDCAAAPSDAMSRVASSALYRAVGSDEHCSIDRWGG